MAEPAGVVSPRSVGAASGWEPDAPLGQDEEPAPLDECPRADPGLWIVNQQTGDAFRTRCGRNGCTYCLPRNAHRRSSALRFVGPERFFTLTQIGDDWQTVRSRVKQFSFDLRAQGFEFELLFSVEPNPAGTGNHLHGWQRGSYLPQNVVSKTADAVGMGSVADIRRWTPRPGGEGYGLKGVGYGMKGAAAADQQSAFLTLNGGRLTHQTRGWWCDPRTGELLGARLAERAAQREKPGGGLWRLERR